MLKYKTLSPTPPQNFHSPTAPLIAPGSPSSQKCHSWQSMAKFSCPWLFFPEGEKGLSSNHRSSSSVLPRALLPRIHFSLRACGLLSLQRLCESAKLLGVLMYLHKELCKYWTFFFFWQNSQVKVTHLWYDMTPADVSKYLPACVC